MRANGNPDVPSVLTVLLLAVPVLAGLAGTALPAFGYLPVLGFETLSLEPFHQLFAEPGLTRSVSLSLGTGLTASIVSLVIVLLFTAGWYGTRTFRRLSRFLSPILSIPHAAAAIGLAFLIAPSGFLVRFISPWATGWTRPPDVLILNDPYGLAMTLGLVAKEVPFLFLITMAALNRPHIQNYFKAGTSLGYGRMATFFLVVLPQIYPLIRLPMLAVIAYATSVVDVAEILGPTTPRPLAPRLIIWMNDPDLAMRLMASAGALLQLFVSAAAIFAFLVLERIAETCLRQQFVMGRRHQREKVGQLAGLIPMLSIIVLMALAIALLVLWSGAKSWWFPATLPQNFSLTQVIKAVLMAGPALTSTLLIASAAAVIATGMTLWLLEARSYRNKRDSRRLKTLIFLPLLLPQVGFLFGLQMFFLVAGIGGTIGAVLLAHLVFVFPYAFLSLSDPWNRLDPRFAKAATSLGASRVQIFWQIQLPLLLRPVLVTFAIAVAISVGQYLPTLMIGAGRIETITTESVALASGGNRQIAALYGLLQLLIPLAAFTLAAVVPSVVHSNRSAMQLKG
ncbi:Inner membrane ABC transporter permease protein YnjC [Roseibium album]|nr:Inner membrane ABC transporter permease protein YnjC [Roseibium album]